VIRSRPLRFLAMVLGGWVTVRLAMLAPGWWTVPAEAEAAPDAPQARLAESGPKRMTEAARSPAAAAPPRSRRLSSARAPLAASASAGTAPIGGGVAVDPGVRPTSAAAAFPPPSPRPAELLSRAPRDARSSVYGWAFVRSGGGSTLAPGGTLGGSQAGLRATYRLNRDSARPLALAVRLASPLAERTAAEGALGIEWRPSRRLPVHLVAERRQKLGRDGRSAFALMVHGGISEAPFGPFQVDAFAQAGMVGARTRDPFVDGVVRLSLPLGGRAKLGAGAWAAAQPGLARLDLGPQASLRLPLGGGNFALAADWRLRVAGDARPGSGPSLTLATDF
jgi:hypothetical protein